MATRNWNHLDALRELEFVGRRLPTGDDRNGTDFVPRDQFVDEPNLVVRVTMERTTVMVDNGPYPEYAVRLDPNTPPSVLKASVEAAIKASK